MFIYFLVACFSAIFILSYVISYLAQVLGNGVKLKYKEFQKYYFLNPEAWNLSDMTYKEQKFKLGFYAYQRFSLFKIGLWIVKRESEKISEICDELREKEKFLKDIQQDIDESMATVNTLIKRANICDTKHS